MILEQAKSAVARLTEQEMQDVRFIAVSLDPTRDTPESMARMARGQHVSAPQWNLTVGPEDEINRVLDDMGVQRAWNEELMRIDHSNVFLLIDRAGRLAYRFSLGELQEQWLHEALKILVNEPEPRP
jgi:protein SCO1